MKNNEIKINVKGKKFELIPERAYRAKIKKDGKKAFIKANKKDVGKDAIVIIDGLELTKKEEKTLVELYD